MFDYVYDGSILQIRGPFRWLACRMPVNSASGSNCYQGESPSPAKSFFWGVVGFIFAFKIALEFLPAIFSAVFFWNVFCYYRGNVFLRAVTSAQLRRVRDLFVHPQRRFSRNLGTLLHFGHAPACKSTMGCARERPQY